jgi:hypothetical protein
MPERLIYHIFADIGVESEVLDAYGRVVRVGLDPIDTNASEPVQADAGELPLKKQANLAVLHPPCQRFSQMTGYTGDPESHPNLIPLARHIGREYADDYVIENVPRAPLRSPEGGDCVVLDGQMFGLPIPKRRQFETSFPLPDPPEYERVEPYGALKAHREGTPWVGTDAEWRSIIGVSGDYPTRELRRSGIPASYIHWIMRAYLQPIAP